MGSVYALVLEFCEEDPIGSHIYIPIGNFWGFRSNHQVSDYTGGLWSKKKNNWNFGLDRLEANQF